MGAWHKNNVLVRSPEPVLFQPDLVDVHASWASSARSYLQCHCEVGDLYCHSLIAGFHLQAILVTCRLAAFILPAGGGKKKSIEDINVNLPTNSQSSPAFHPKMSSYRSISEQASGIVLLFATALEQMRRRLDNKIYIFNFSTAIPSTASSTEIPITVTVRQLSCQNIRSSEKCQGTCSCCV